MQAEASDADVIVMAAAVADFRPADVAAGKIKKDDSGAVPALGLERTTDVLAELVTKRGAARSPLIIGFAAETARDHEHLLELGAHKLARKGCDLLVINEVGSSDVFGSADNAVTILGSDGAVQTLGRRSKADIADGVWDAVGDRIRSN
jgi:phosphopantothenoylcysteine decarboxylase/phosphopantothenate--cysteine ligase